MTTEFSGSQIGIAAIISLVVPSLFKIAEIIAGKYRPKHDLMIESSEAQRKTSKFQSEQIGELQDDISDLRAVNRKLGIENMKSSVLTHKLTVEAQLFCAKHPEFASEFKVALGVTGYP